jgi:transcriptional regulator with AAA-type ATPase domain/predicted ATPase
MVSSSLIAPVHPTERLVGQAPAIVALRAQIRHLVTFDTPGNPFVPTLLLQGETGTGKGLVARVIHASGPRAQGPFLEVNCAAIPETLLEAELFGFEAGAFTDAKRAKPGLWEAASGGMLFLDEIEALPLTLQSKVLTVIEAKRVRRLGAVVERPVDVKLIVATQTDLPTRAAEGQFRTDLYHRLAVILLAVPPLRARGDDAVLLAQHFLQQYASAHRLTHKQLGQEAEVWLRNYAWPGNVRELSHLMERVMLLRPETVVVPEMLAQLCLSPVPPSAATEAAEGGDEAVQIRQALLQTAGNVARAARLLQMSRGALRHRMARYGITPSRQESPRVVPAPGQRVHQGEGLEAPHNESHTVQIHRPSPERTADWEQKPVAVLAIEVTWATTGERDTLRYEPWTVRARWEQDLVQKVQGFGGVVVQRGPSLLLVVFGLPHTLEQLPHRAVQTACVIRQMTCEEQDAWEGAPWPMVRQAVHWGQVLVAAGAQDPAAQVLPLEETLAWPVRLLGHAAPGEILISAPAGRLIAGWFELQACEQFLPAYSVVGFRSQRSPLALHGQRPLSQFVGRARELALLAELLEQAVAGRGQVVGLVGDPGMGKSRLLYEFHCQFGIGAPPTPAAPPVLYLEGHCMAYGSAIPYLPVLDLLQSRCGIVPNDRPAVLAEKVHLAMQTAGMDPDAEGPYLFPLLGIQTDTDQLAGLSPEVLRARTFATLRRLLLPGNPRHPVVLAVENLHWIDQTSEAFIASLVEGIAGAPLLVLTTYRPGYRPPWMEKSYVTQLVLHPLLSQESRGMLQALLQPVTLPAPLVQTILTRAQGNPFFLEEIVQALVEQGVLGQGEAGGAAAGAPFLPEMQLPPTVQGVLTARLDRLPPAEKALLQTLAVIGTVCPWRLLTRVVGQPEEALHQPLGALQAAEFLYEQPARPELTYQFKHVLTQEAAYTSLTAERRRMLHERTAQALEALYTDRLEEHYGALAYHYRASGNTAKAVTYLQQAGQQALQRAAYVEAIAYLGEGLEMLATLPETSARLQDELTLRLALGTALIATKGWAAPEVVAAYTRARELCQQLGETPQLLPVLWGLATFYFVRAEHQTVQELGAHLLRLTQHRRDPALRIAAHFVQSNPLFFLGEFLLAREHLEQGIRCYAPSQHRDHTRLFSVDLGVFCLSWGPLALWQLGAPDQALRRSHAALELAQELAHPFSLAVALAYAAMFHQFRREAQATRERAEAAIALCRTHGFTYYLAWATILRGWAVAAQGQPEVGLAQMVQGLDALRATGGEVRLPYYLALLAEVSGHAGQIEAGRRLLAEALAHVHTKAEHWWEAELYRLQGELRLARAGDQSTDAEACVQQALALARRQHAQVLELRAAMSLSRLWQRQSKRSEAGALLAPIYGRFTEGFETADLQEARTLLDALT